MSVPRNARRRRVTRTRKSSQSGAHNHAARYRVEVAYESADGDREHRVVFRSARHGAPVLIDPIEISGIVYRPIGQVARLCSNFGTPAQ